MSTDDRKFLHTLALVDGSSICPRYLINGDEWYGSDNGGHHESMSLHPADGVILQITRAYEGSGFCWRWSLKLADGVYANHNGSADSVEAAAAAAIAYAPRVLTFNYINESTWYETSEGRFAAAIDGEGAEINKYSGTDGYRWQRTWSPAKEISQAMTGYSFHIGQLAGDAPTPEAAMIACIEAPHRLKAACATLIASLREQEAPVPDAEQTRLRAALDEIAHSNRTKTGLKELAKAALFPAQEAAC
ncbi:MAG: hypothetical protein HYU78_09590 [Rhodocyclales bacterium]|nr:hypothetical protein [Rhodocyclales bacterium]